MKIATPIALLLGLLLAAGCGGGPDRVGRSYTRLADLQHAMEDGGWVLVGKVGALTPGKPAKVTESREAEDKIAVRLKDGVLHEYDGFAGYDLKAVRLAAGGSEMAVIFRSREKR